MERLRPNEKRAKNAILLIWLVMAAELIAIVSSYFSLNLIHVYETIGFISEEKATANDVREGVVAAIYLILWVISGIFFIQWFRRAYFNLHQRVNNLTRTDGWAAGGWFVPIANLYIPFQMMVDLFKETKQYLNARGVSFHGNLSTNILGIWWALWIIGAVASQFELRYPSDTMEDVKVGTYISIISSILTIPLGFATIKLINDYSQAEQAFHKVPIDEPELVA